MAINISDNGPGIPQELAPRVFEPFFTTKAFGTGLDLAISKRLADLIDATLELRNRIPHGLDVVLTLRNTKASREEPAMTAYGTNSGGR